MTRELLVGMRARPVPASAKVHGLGVLMVRLSDDTRLHIWHSSLRVPEVSPIHNHVWSFRSHVVCGRLEQHRYTRASMEDAAVDQNVKPYLRAEITPGPSPQPVMKNPVLLRQGQKEVYTPGQTYDQGAAELHSSHPIDGTVTIVEQSGRDEDRKATICWEHGEFVSAVPRRATESEWDRVLNAALEHLAEPTLCCR